MSPERKSAILSLAALLDAQNLLNDHSSPLSENGPLYAKLADELDAEIVLAIKDVEQNDD